MAEMVSEKKKGRKSEKWNEKRRVDEQNDGWKLGMGR